MVTQSHDVGFMTEITVNWVIFTCGKLHKNDSVLHICESMNSQVAV